MLYYLCIAELFVVQYCTSQGNVYVMLCKNLYFHGLRFSFCLYPITHPSPCIYLTISFFSLSFMFYLFSLSLLFPLFLIFLSFSFLSSISLFPFSRTGREVLDKAEHKIGRFNLYNHAFNLSSHVFLYRPT